MTIRPRRSVLYMPGSNARAIEKARSLPADAIILDLEDSVAPQSKTAARQQVADAVKAGGFGPREVVVRINGLDTEWWFDDLNVITHAKPNAILIPKVSSPEQFDDVIERLIAVGAGHEVRVWAMMETPLAMLHADRIAAAALDPEIRLTAFVMGTNDLAKETRARILPGRAGMLPWLMTCVAAARAYGVEIIDGVYNDLGNAEGFAQECAQARDLGFDGKTLIHPNQIAPCNAVFSPDAAEVAQARAIIAAFDLPENHGKGVVALDGRMVERLHADMARRTVAIAEAIAARTARRCPQEMRQPVVWFEVEDFLRYFDHFRNPTGLQRVPFEIYAEAERLYGGGGRVRFCRLSVYSKQFQAIDFEAISSAYLDPPGAGAPWRTIWEPAQFGSELSGLLAIVRHPRFFFSIFRAAVRDLVLRFRPNDFERMVQPGDIVVSLGAGWAVPHYIKHIADAKRRYGIKFSMLIYDLIPIEHESFVEQRHVVQFRNWLAQAMPVADVVLTISMHSRDALIRLTAAAGWSRPRIEVVELGSRLGDRPIAEDQETSRAPQPYVLFVSTIEIRKNHRLLVRVWRRLLERHGPDAVPVLIFAGQIGWLVDDLMAELAASGHLGGKIRLMPGLSDAELRQAYRGCLFTVYPSLCEGWGLPIAESLAQGKFCVASNATSIPEVGGDLVDYFDPSDDDDALAKIERAMLDPVYLAAKEARLQAEYRPQSWGDCVHALIGKLARPPSADLGAHPGVDR